MKRAIGFLVLIFSLCGVCFSQTDNTVNVTVEISNIVVNGGKVYLVLFLSNESFNKDEPDILYELQSDKVSVIKEISVPRGEYVVFVFQDSNKNLKLDYGLFGIPKEIMGITNYSGKGYPSREFNKQKILIDEKTGKINLKLYKL